MQKLKAIIETEVSFDHTQRECWLFEDEKPFSLDSKQMSRWHKKWKIFTGRIFHINSEWGWVFNYLFSHFHISMSFQRSVGIINCSSPTCFTKVRVSYSKVIVANLFPIVNIKRHFFFLFFILLSHTVSVITISRKAYFTFIVMTNVVWSRKRCQRLFPFNFSNLKNRVTSRKSYE